MKFNCEICGFECIDVLCERCFESEIDLMNDVKLMNGNYIIVDGGMFDVDLIAETGCKITFEIKD